MRRESFYAKGNRSGDVLHIETDGCIVNIYVGLTDHDGNPVTRVDVSPDDETRSPDMDGHYWHTEDVDGQQLPGVVARVVRQPRPGGRPDPRFSFHEGDAVIFTDARSQLEGVAGIKTIHRSEGGIPVTADLDVDGALQTVFLADVRAIPAELRAAGDR